MCRTLAPHRQVDIGAFIISLVYLEIKMRSEVVLYENQSQSGQ